MLKRWSEAGKDVDQFWRQTPRTIRAVLDGLSDARAWGMKLALSGAWWAAVIPKMQTPPSLPELLGEDASPSPVQSVDDAFVAWQSATARAV